MQATNPGLHRIGLPLQTWYRVVLGKDRRPSDQGSSINRTRTSKFPPRIAFHKSLAICIDLSEAWTRFSDKNSLPISLPMLFKKRSNSVAKERAQACLGNAGECCLST